MVRRRLTPQERREEILAAGERLFRQRGPAVRVEDIVEAAGAAKGTFYTCFETMDDLLAEIRARHVRRLQAAIPPPEAAPRADLLLQDVARRFVEFVLGLEGLHEVLFHTAFAQSRPLPPASRPAARIAAILRLGQGQGVFAAGETEITARLLFAAMHETVDAIGEGADKATALAALADLIARAVPPAKTRRKP